MQFLKPLEMRVFVVLYAIVILMTAVSFLFFAPGIYSCRDVVLAENEWSFDQKMYDECVFRQQVGVALLAPHLLPMYTATILANFFLPIIGIQLSEWGSIIIPLFTVLIFTPIEMLALSYLLCAAWRFVKGRKK